MSVRAKFQCHAKTEMESPEGAVDIQLSAVYESGIDGNACEENRIFGESTPSATLQMVICNPEASKQFEVGKCYYVDFTEAPN